MTKKKTKKAPKKIVKKFDDKAFYKKYSHAVRGSVKEVKPGTVIDGTKAVHGRVCKITCTTRGCSKTRTLNVQDCWQVKFCREHQKAAASKRAADRRKAKNK